MEWIKTLFDWIYNLTFFVIIKPDEGGVLIRCGKYARTIYSGIYFKFPLVDIVERINIREQIVRTQQSVTTKDGKMLAVEGVVRYEITDPRKALFSVMDVDDTLNGITEGSINSCVSRTSKCTHDKLQKAVLAEIETEAEEWGVEILDFYIPTLTEQKVYTILGGGYVPVES